MTVLLWQVLKPSSMISLICIIQMQNSKHFVPLTTHIVLNFLRRHKYIEAFLALERQSGIYLQQLPQEINCLRNMLIEGDFEAVVKSLQSLKSHLTDISFRQMILMLRKQQLYELIQKPDPNQIRNLIERPLGLKQLTSNQEFRRVLSLLKLKSVREVSQLFDWTMMKGRLDCFQIIYKNLQIRWSKLIEEPTNYPHLQNIIEATLSKRVKPHSPKSRRSPPKELKESKIKSVMQPTVKSQIKTSRVSSKKQRSRSPKSRSPISRESQYFQPRIRQSAKQPASSNQRLQILWSGVADSKLMEHITFGKRKEPSALQQIMSGVQKLKSSLGGGQASSEKSSPRQEQRQQLSNSEVFEQSQSLAERNEFKVYEQFRSQVSRKDQKDNIMLEYLKDSHHPSVGKELPFQTFKAKSSKNRPIKLEQIRLVHDFRESAVIRMGRISPKKKYVAYGTNNSCLKIFQLKQILQQEQCKPTFDIFRLFEGSVYAFDFSPSESLLVACSNDNTVKLISLDSSPAPKIKLLGNHDQRNARYVQFFQQQTAASCGQDGLVKLWDLQKVCLKSQHGILNENPLASLKCWDNQIITSGQCKKLLRVDQRMQSFVQLGVLQSQINSVTRNETNIFTAQKNHSLSNFDLRTNKHRSYSRHKAEVRSVNISPLGNQLVTASFDCTVAISEVQDLWSERMISLQAHNDKAVWAAWGGQGLLISSGSDFNCRVWAY